MANAERDEEVDQLRPVTAGKRPGAGNGSKPRTEMRQALEQAVRHGIEEEQARRMGQRPIAEKVRHRRRVMAQCLAHTPYLRGRKEKAIEHRGVGAEYQGIQEALVAHPGLDQLPQRKKEHGQGQHTAHPPATAKPHDHSGRSQVQGKKAHLNADPSRRRPPQRRVRPLPLGWPRLRPSQPGRRIRQHDPGVDGSQQTGCEQEAAQPSALTSSGLLKSALPMSRTPLPVSVSPHDQRPQVDVVAAG